MAVFASSGEHTLTTERGTDSAALAAVLGGLADSAATGAVTTADTEMAYIKQILNVLMGADGISSFPAEAAPGNGVSLAEVLRAIHVDVTGIAGSSMRGTDSAALASVMGALDASAAAGVPTTSDTAMAYIKQIVNVLMGSTGIATWPSGAAPADGVSIAEGIRKIAEDVVIIDAFHDVAVADASTNVHMSDIVGNKSDAAAAGAVSTAESIMAFTKQLVTMQRRVVHHMDFWSAVEDLITITTSADDKTLPSIIVGDLPSGVVVVRSTVMMKYRAIENTNASANSMTVSSNFVQIDKTGGSWTDAITLVASTFQVAGETRDGGDVLVGDLDVASEVDANDTYELRIEQADAAGNNLLLRDVQTGVRIYFTLE